MSSHPSQQLSAQRAALFSSTAANRRGSNPQLEDDERVEVNQRHLIDKILARYSSDYTVFRELLQNSNDACSSQVIIDFEGTSGSTHNEGKIKSLTFKNNGKPFSPADWTRLKKIAEGNPDEDKIGFFGVGFYSLFSICEEPFVDSGGACMAFYWKGDQLFVKKGKEDGSYGSGGESLTSFYLDLRDEMEVFIWDDFCRFICKSLLFTTNLSQVTVNFNEQQLFKVVKAKFQSEDAKKLIFSSSHYHSYSPLKFFKIEMASFSEISLTVDKLYDSRSKNLLTSFLKFANIKSESDELKKPGVYNLSLKSLDGTASVHLPSGFASQMERCTKKQPSRIVKIQIIYSSSDEAGLRLASKNPLFLDVAPIPQGRVYIGFPTHQTTGLGAHMALHLIPTVERELIDFVDPVLKKWNEEMIAMSTTFLRSIYDQEMNLIKKTTNEVKSIEDIPKASMSRLMFFINLFSFDNSVPNDRVSQIIRYCFVHCSKESILVLSTKGIVPLDSVRQIPKELLSFLKCTPMILPELLKSNPNESGSGTNIFIFLEQNNLIPQLTQSDVIGDLKNSVLSETDFIACLNWMSSADIPRRDVHYHKELRHAVKFTADNQGTVSEFSKIAAFVNINIIPFDAPIPSNCLAPSISRHLTPGIMLNLGLSQLSFIQWVAFACNERKDFEENAEYSEKVLNIICKCLTNNSSLIKSDDRAIVASIVMNKRCIPTKQGMKYPKDAYLSNVNIFSDLPNVSFTVPKAKSYITDQYLIDFGVKATPSITMVFERIESLHWDQVQLLKYLASVQEHLTENDLIKLKNSAIFEAYSIEACTNPSAEKIYKRYKISDIYFWSEIIEQLGLPILCWNKGTVLKGSAIGSLGDIGIFLKRLGVNVYIPLSVLLQKITLFTSNIPFLIKLFEYFFENYQQNANYKDDYRRNYLDWRFVPYYPKSLKDEQIGNEGSVQFLSPNECFVDPRCELLGFKSLPSFLNSFSAVLAIKEYPNGTSLVNALKAKRLNIEESIAVFNYLAMAQNSFSRSDLVALNSLPFIPGKSKDSQTVLYYAPNEVYFSPTSYSSTSSPSANENQFSDIFVYVDYYKNFHEATQFLKLCGVESEPSPLKLAEYIIKDSKASKNDKNSLNCLERLGVEKYLGILRYIAVHGETIKRQSSITWENLKKESVLLGFKPVKSKSSNSIEDESERQQSDIPVISEYILTDSKGLYLLDDSISQQIFDPIIAPTETVIEQFYQKLGVTWLSSAVSQKWKFQGTPRQSESTMKLEKSVRERAPLLIYGLFQSQSHRDLSAAKSSSSSTLKDLRILQIDSISVVREFEGKVKEIHSTACIYKDKGLSERDFVILVTANYDPFDFSLTLTKVLGHSSSSGGGISDALLLSTLLITPLNSLRTKGFPVDRLLLKAKESKNVVLPTSRIEGRQHYNESSKVPQVLEEHKDDVHSNIQETDQPIFDQASVQHPQVSVHQEQPQQQISNSPSKPSKHRSLFGSLINNIKGNHFGSKHSSHSSSSQFPGVTPTSNEGSKVSISPSLMKTALQSSIASCQSNSKSDISSMTIATEEENRSASIIKEREYCSVKSPQSLQYIGSVDGGKVEVYRETLSPQSASMDTMIELMPLFASFAASTLSLLSATFGLDKRALHIFYEPGGSVIAFNRNKSIFYNYWYQSERMREGTASDSGEKESAVFWYLVTCHELAHNFIAPHDSNHEYFMSSFAENYFIEFVKNLGYLNNT